MSESIKRNSILRRAMVAIIKIGTIKREICLQGTTAFKIKGKILNGNIWQE